MILMDERRTRVKSGMGKVFGEEIRRRLFQHEYY
jgi:hypothetical protein